jgi:hypothetical protein
MALTVSTGAVKGRSGPDALGPRATALFVLTGDNSYPTGGWAFDPKQYSGFTPAVVFIAQRAPLTVAYQFVYDRTAKKLLVFWSAGSGAAFSQVTNATDLSAVIVDMLLVGD